MKYFIEEQYDLMRQFEADYFENGDPDDSQEAKYIISGMASVILQMIEAAGIPYYYYSSRRKRFDHSEILDWCRRYKMMHFAYKGEFYIIPLNDNQTMMMRLAWAEKLSEVEQE